MGLRRDFLKPMFGMAFVLSSVSWVVLASICIAQGHAPSERIIVTEDMAFSWPIVVLIVVSAVGYGGVVWSIKQHHAERGIHLTAQDVAVEHPRRSECDLRHQSVRDSLDRIEKRLTELVEKLGG